MNEVFTDEVKIQKDFAEWFRPEWNKIRRCSQLLREGKAKIVKVTRIDGTTRNYTELKKGRCREYERKA